MVPLTITSNEPLAKCSLPVPVTLHSSDLDRGLSSKGRNVSTGRHNNDSIELEVRLPPGHFGICMPPSQQEKKRMTVLAGVIDPDHQGETELLFHKRDKGECVWNTGNSLGHSCYYHAS